ncbi:MAG TPA: FAD-binding protein [Gammaproteobacteria bacterium]
MAGINRYNSDVLIIGGGGAATAAAIAAHEGGATTMLAVKGRFGVPGVRGAGATSNPIGDFWTIRTVGPKGGFFNPPEIVLQDMLQTGLGMADPALCRIFVEEVPDAIRRLQTMGMKFQSRVLATMPADTGNKTNSIVAVQKAIIEETGTRVLEHANLTDLIVNNGECHGAIGIHDNGEPFVVEAGAVILATGGIGQLFQYSFNPPGNTGDGYAMALRAGAELFNMEFMQQGLATTWPQQGIVMLYEMEQPYKMFNRHGRSFLHNYLPDGIGIKDVCDAKARHWPVSCRDDALYLDIAIKAEALAGNATEHDGVLLDLSQAERGFLPELFPGFMLEKGIDIKNDLVQIQNHHHTSNGGIRVDEHGQSAVKGLFAVGETAGWQGADRLGGTMLGGSQVFGRRAGRKAAELAKGANGSAVGDDLIEPLLEPLRRLQESKGRRTVAELHKALQRKMWETLIVAKDADTLNEARQFIYRTRDQLDNDLAITRELDYALALELRNMLDAGEAIVEAADVRTESRGAHYRSDFPERNDTDWLTNIFISRANGQLDLRKEWVCTAQGWEDRPGDVRIKPWG